MLTDSADRRTPRAVREALARFGGLNRFGRANWRVIVAQDHLVRRAGVFKTMPSGNVKSLEIDPKTFKMEYREVRPEKVVRGVRDVPKYPGAKGWVLERWFAPETVNRREWESALSSDGVTPMMGPYPERGYYFMLAGPWEQMPELHDLKMAIAMHIREEENRPREYAQLLKQEVEADRVEEEKQYQKVLSDLQHFYDSEVEPILNGSSLAASRIRNENARATGNFSHQGIF